MSVSPPVTHLGATSLGSRRCRFRVWAPFAEIVDVRLGAPRERLVRMSPAGGGYHEAVVEEAPPGCRYRYRFDDGEREYADPASRFQPEGVHGPSEVVSREFDWTDGGWRGLALRDLVFYELHVGTFTPEGDFDAVARNVEELRSLGITVIELMPVAEFPGERNWGYDGVFPFAVQSSYGGPSGLKRLVDSCHRLGLAVALDVVYNHVGPEGNVFGEFGPYFTDRYRTPWGPAIRFDGPGSDAVRRFFIENALYWLEEFHLDVLRLDAVHAIQSSSGGRFLDELSPAVDERFPDRKVYLVPESHDNDPRLVRPREMGGIGFDAVWNDDFHHALRALLTGERGGYFQDYGGLGHLEKAYREGFVLTGEYSAYRERRHGSSSSDVSPERFVVFAQNHDQVGNRPRGERLTVAASFEKLKLAAGFVLLSPNLPLLFMGEEYGETAPFPYFVSHSDPELVEAVRRGRRAAFAAFDGNEEPPDPQDPGTFRAAVLRRERRELEPGRTLYILYRELLRMRRELPSLALRTRERMKVKAHGRSGVLQVEYWTEEPTPDHVLILFHLADEEDELDVHVPEGAWERTLDSASAELRGGGPLAPDRLPGGGVAAVTLPGWSFVVYRRTFGSIPTATR